MKRILSSPLGKLVVALLVFTLIFGGWIAYHRYRDATAELPDAATPADSCTLWFVGSSSIHRWTSLQQDMAPWATHNRGINGAMLTDILPRFANIDPAEGRPRAIILYVGENDLASGVPVRTVMRQVATFFDLRDRLLPGVPVLMLSAKPSPGRKQFFGQQHLLNAATRNFLPHLRAAYYGDITTPLFAGGILGDSYQSDGIHMNARGYRIWAQVVRARLDEILPAKLTQACAPRG